MLKEISSRVLGPLFATMFGLFLLVLMPIDPGDHKQADLRGAGAVPVSDTFSAENEKSNVGGINRENIEQDSTRAGYSFGVDSINEEKAD